MSVPEMWKRLFLRVCQTDEAFFKRLGPGLECTYQSTHETYSPVGNKNLRIYWSGCQSTGAEMRKYLTATVSAAVAGVRRRRDRCATSVGLFVKHYLRLSTCWSATMQSGGRLCCAS